MDKIMEYKSHYPNYTQEDYKKLKTLTGLYRNKDIYAFITVLFFFDKSITKLSGVARFAFYQSIYEKKILLLGDIHNTRGLCTEDSVNVNMWFISLVKDSFDKKECLDIFLEGSYKELIEDTFTPSITAYRSPLISLHASLRYLITNFPELTQNLRVHPIDIRSKLKRKDLSEIFYAISRKSYLEQNTFSEISSEFTTEEEIIYRTLLGMAPTEEGKNVLLHFLLDSQMELQDTDFSKEHIMDNINWYISIIQKELSKCSFDLQEQLLKIYMSNGESLWQNIIQIPMDVYVLSRLFIRFNTIKRKPTGTCRDVIQNCILCVGGKHLKTYMKVLGQPSIYYDVYRSKEYQCIEFDEPFVF